MLFLTPPKIHDFKSPSPSPSPLLDIMQSLNDMLADEEVRKKMLDPELIKLLDGTPVQASSPIKQFVATKSSRNISDLFSQEKTLKISVPEKTQKIVKGQLSKVDNSKAFYPQNYNWTQHATYDSDNTALKQTVKPMNQQNLSVTSQNINELYNRPIKAGKANQETMANAPKSSNKTLKLPTSNSWKKAKFDKYSKKQHKNTSKRADSKNSNKENVLNEKAVESVPQQPPQMDQSSFNFPEGGWV